MDFRPQTDEDGDRQYCSINDLLAEQLLAVQKAMTLNGEVAKRLIVEHQERQRPTALNEEVAKRLKDEHQERERLSQIRQPELLQPPPWKASVDFTEPLLNKPSPAFDGLKPRVNVPEQTNLTTEDFTKQVEKTLGQNEPEYRVESLYSKTGRWQDLAKNSCFQDLALVVIVFNSIWIAIDTDFNHAQVLSEAPWPFQVMENAFSFFFVIEISVRFLAFERKCLAFTDAWFVFDAILVAFMVAETWIVPIMTAIMGNADGMANMGSSSILRVFRLLRLTRVTRMARVLRAVPELVVLVKGMAMGMRSVCATFGLLMALVYIFAILLTQLLKDSDTDLQLSFSGVVVSMNTLLMQGIFSDQAQFFGQMLDEGFVYYGIFMLFMLTGAFTVMNMLIGVLCDVMGNMADEQKDEAAVSELKIQIGKLIANVDLDGDRKVSKSEFALMLQSNEALQSLTAVEVDIHALVQFADFIFRDNNAMSVSQFTNAVLQFRSTTPASMKDLVEMRHFMSKQLHDLEGRLLQLTER